MKPKSVLIVRTMDAHEEFLTPDVERKLKSGSYLVAVKPKKPSAVALRQRDFIKRRKEAGDKHLSVYLPESVYALLLSVLREGETQAELVERLLYNITSKS